MAAPPAVTNQGTRLQPSPSGRAADGNPSFARLRPEAARLVEGLRGEGGLGTAFAAFLRFRADLLAPEYLDALRQTVEWAPPLDAGQCAAALLRALGSGASALLEHLQPGPLWSTVSRCAFASRWHGKQIVVQIALDPVPDSTFDLFEQRVAATCSPVAPQLTGRTVLDQFRQWVRLADDPGRERGYLEATAGLGDRIAVRYPVPIAEISKGRVLCWEWQDGEPLETRFQAGDPAAALKLAEIVLEQICVLSVVDADLDTADIVVSGDKLAIRRANRLCAIPPPRVRTALRYVSAVLSANSPVAVRSLLKLTWGQVAVEHEARMLDELSALGPALKGGRRFAPSANMAEANWRALAKVSGSRPLHVDALHRNLIAVAYRNSEVNPGTDCMVDAQWPVTGRILRLRAGALLDRQTASEWIAGSGLLMFESMRQANRLADEFRDNEMSIGVDQAPKPDEDRHHADRSTGVWILIGVFFVMFLISLRWAAMLPSPYSAVGTVFAIAGALGLFRTVSKIG